MAGNVKPVTGGQNRWPSLALSAAGCSAKFVDALLGQPYPAAAQSMWTQKGSGHASFHGPPQMRYSGGSLMAPFHLRRAARSLVTASICSAAQEVRWRDAREPRLRACCHVYLASCCLVCLPAVQPFALHPLQLHPPPTHLRVGLDLVHVQRRVARDGADLAGGRPRHQRARRHLPQHSGARRHL